MHDTEDASLAYWPCSFHPLLSCYFYEWINHGLAMKRSDKELQNEWSHKFVVFSVLKWSNVTLNKKILGDGRISNFSSIQNEVADFKWLLFLNE